MRLSIPRRIAYKDLSLYVMVLLLVLLMFASFSVYFTWNIPSSVLYVITSFSCLLFLYYNRKALVFNRGAKTILFLLFSLFLYEYIRVIPKGILPLCGAVGTFICTSVFFFLDGKYKQIVINFFIKFIAILTVFSLLWWFLFLLGVDLPCVDVKYDETDFYNHRFYYLFLYNVPKESTSIPRFAGFFLEPGHLASTFVFLIYLCRFNFRRWETIVFLVSILFSLSLAGYALLFISFFLYVYTVSKVKFFNYLLLFTLISVVVVFTSVFYKNGNNVLNKKIISRLEVKDGKLKGNNRTTALLEWKYRTHFVKDSKNIWLGYGRYMYGENSSGVVDHLHYSIGCAGWKRYYMTRGVIGVALLLMLLLSIYRFNKSSFGLCFLILYLICNFVRDYPTNELWLFLYMFAIPYFHDN